MRNMKMRYIISLIIFVFLVAVLFLCGIIINNQNSKLTTQETATNSTGITEIAVSTEHIVEEPTTEVEVEDVEEIEEATVVEEPSEVPVVDIEDVDNESGKTTEDVEFETNENPTETDDENAVEEVEPEETETEITEDEKNNEEAEDATEPEVVIDADHYSCDLSDIYYTSPVREYTEWQKELIAKMLYCESGSTSWDCQVATCSAIINLIEHYGGDFSILDKPNVFTPATFYRGVTPMQTQYDVLDYVLSDHLIANIKYFRTSYYHSFGTPMFAIDNVHFSK